MLFRYDIKTFIKYLFAVTVLTFYITHFCIAKAQDRVDSITPFIRIAPEVHVQLGVIGTNPEHVVEPVAVFNINSSGINTTFGKGKDGVLYDFSVTRPFLNDFNYRIATRNHAWGNAFMDNKLELFNSYQLIDTDSSEFYIRPNITGAFSNQRFENNLVSDLRLASTLTSEWKQDLKAFGTFRLKNTNNISFYPSTSAWQYAFRLQPAWIIPFAQHSFVTSYDFQITNAASPFDGNIDRLSDINQIHAYWHYDAPDFIKGNLKNTVGIAYDWRKDSTQNQSLLRSAYWVLDTKQNFNMLEWVLRLELQAAAFFSQVDDPDLRAGILLNNDFYHNDWRYHFKTEYKFVHPDKENDIDMFEFGLGPVIEFESQRFRPYLAFDFADSLFNAGGLESIKLSGFGFEVLQ